MTPRIAVLIPCFDEASTIAKVVADFRARLAQADIFVYDNNSRDDTAERARIAGAQVRHESLRGKGQVVRRMFRDVDADFYVLVDGDDTYDADSAPRMLELARSGPYDLVNCIRDAQVRAAYPHGHRIGNRLLGAAVRLAFGHGAHDMLSGYKVLSRRFVKSFPALSQGFDIETELTVHALELAMPVAHLHAPYRSRPPGSSSKLNTWRDGWRIAGMIARLVRHERPLLFFGGLALALISGALLLALPLLPTYLRSGLVPRLPTAVLATGIVLLAAGSLFAGLVLDTVTRGRRELRLLAYLQHGPFRASDPAAGP